MSCLWFFDKAHFINLSAGLVMDKHTVIRPSSPTTVHFGGRQGPLTLTMGREDYCPPLSSAASHGFTKESLLQLPAYSFV